MKTLRTIRRDLTVLTSLCLLGLVALSVLTGLGMDDEAEGLLSLDDIHPLIGFAMALVTGVHVMLQLGALRTYVKRRLTDIVSEPPRRGDRHTLPPPAVP